MQYYGFVVNYLSLKYDLSLATEYLYKDQRLSMVRILGVKWDLKGSGPLTWQGRIE